MIVLRYREQRTGAETAALLGCSEGASRCVPVRSDHHGIELLAQCVSVSMSLIWYTCRGGVANVA